MILPRRNFLLGLGSVLAAPAIVKAASLMPVKVMEPTLASLGWEVGEAVYCVIYNEVGGVLTAAKAVRPMSTKYIDEMSFIDMQADFPANGPLVVPAQAKGALMHNGHVLWDFTLDTHRNHPLQLMTGDSLRVRIELG